MPYLLRIIPPERERSGGVKFLCGRAFKSLYTGIDPCVDVRRKPRRTGIKTPTLFPLVLLPLKGFAGRVSCSEHYATMTPAGSGEPYARSRLMSMLTVTITTRFHGVK